jgi:Protein of unknown function (DUF2971)
MSLFKYTSASLGMRILETGKIRFSQPASFNDPFEASPFISAIYTNEQIESLLNQLLKSPKLVDAIMDEAIGESYHLLPSWARGILNPDKVKRIFYKVLSDNHLTLFDFMRGRLDYDAMRTTLVQKFFIFVGRVIGILSLSKINNSLLMWAHYAQAHQGVVIELDEDHPFFSKLEDSEYSGKVEVNYSSQRPGFPLDFGLDHEVNKHIAELFGRVLYFTKSIEWMYEAEVRCMRVLFNATPSGYIDEKGFDIHLFDLPSDCVRGILFGCRISVNDEQTFLRLASTQRYCHLTLKKAQIDQRCFKLNFSDIHKV